MTAFRTLCAYFWRYAEGRRWILVFYTGLFVIANVLILFEPLLIGKLLNGIQQAGAQAQPFRSIAMNFVLLVCLSGGFWLFHGPARVLERMTSFTVRRNFKDHLFRIVTGLPLTWHKDHHSGETINRIGKATGALYEFTGNAWQYLEMGIRLLGSVIALTILLPKASVLAFSICAGAIAVVLFFDRILFRTYRSLNEKDHAVAVALHDYLTNIQTIITLRLERLIQGELSTRMSHYLPLFRKNVVLNEGKWFVMTLIISTMTASVLAWYAFTTLAHGEILLAGTFFMLYEYLQKIGGAFSTFAGKYSGMIQQYADVLAAEDILALESGNIPQKRGLPDDWKRIEIENLRFTYQDEQHHTHHLRDIALVLTRGKSIALVGESGSGKSTLMCLICNLHAPENVTIRCDGIPLHGFQDIAAHVTLIPQDTELFSNTIEYNITVDSAKPDRELSEDIDLASFTSVLARLPKGLQTHISEKGVNLSGGEKQRLALARGIFAAKGSDIILLDEPTSSVDLRNELLIYRNLLERFHDRCIVSSVHRLHLLPMFDEIYVLEAGEVREHGTFQTLLQQGGLLSQIWEEQVRQSDPERKREPSPLMRAQEAEDQHKYAAA